MGWIYLVTAILLEIFGTTMMKLSNGMTILLPTIGMFIGYILCFASFAMALKTIDMSVAYAIWCALGIVLIALIGILFFHESFNIPKLLGLLLIVIGVVTLKLNS